MPTRQRDKKTVPSEPKDEVRQEVLKAINQPEPERPESESEGEQEKQVNAGLRQRLMRHKAKVRMVVILPVVLAVLYAIFFLTRADRSLPALAKVLPWPAAVIEGDVIWHGELMREVDTFRRVAADQQAFSDSAIENIALERLMELSLIKRELERLEMRVTEEDVDRQAESITAQFGSSEALEQYLEQSYGWSMSELRERMLKPFIERSMLASYLSQDPEAMANAARAADELRSRIISEEMSFEQAAQQYSRDTATAGQGGSLGWFTWGTMVPEFESALRDLKVGEISQPVATQFGVHLIRLDGLQDASEGGEVGSANASHILIPIADYGSWLQARRASAKVTHLLPLGQMANE